MGEAALSNSKDYVLVVDDSRVVRWSIVKFLAPYFNVIEAENGMAGWQLLKQSSLIGLVITDIQMPEMDGYTFICKVRASEDPGLRDIPVIAVTGMEDDVTRERAYACGANGFVSKPLNTNQLLSCVKTHLADYYQSIEPVEEKAAPSPIINGEMTGPNANGKSLESAVAYIDMGMKMLAELNTTTVTPHALTLVPRFMPLLRFCNTRFKLGMDSEISLFQQRVTTAREAARKSRNS